MQQPNEHTYSKLLDCVTLEGVRAHQAAFQAIANANDDLSTRAAARRHQGMTASVDTSSTPRGGRLQRTRTRPVRFSSRILQQPTPSPAYPAGTLQVAVRGHDRPGDSRRHQPSTARPREHERLRRHGLRRAELRGPGRHRTDPARRLHFRRKVANAQTAGADAVIIFNQGNTPERETLIVGTLRPRRSFVHDNPRRRGHELRRRRARSRRPGTTARVAVINEPRTDVNVIAELAGQEHEQRRDGRSAPRLRPEGPGINDNGSGSAAILETALMLAKVKPENTVRFAWWGAEEEGLVGSTAYVDGLSAGRARPDRHVHELRHGRLAELHLHGVRRGPVDVRRPRASVPTGSIAIEDLYESYYTLVGEPYDDTEFSGRSDYQAFIEKGIPSGGLFTGAEEIKTAEQQAIWGGTTGEQFDPCYHESCDTFANNNDHALTSTATSSRSRS